MKDVDWMHLLWLVTTLGGNAVLASPFDNSNLSEHVIRSEKGVLHLPISRQAVKNELKRRDGLGQTAQIGLGDVNDGPYSVQLQLGSVSSAFFLDTGSSDLWAVADTYIGDIKRRAPLYSTKSFWSLGIDFSIHYGDSHHPTSADGVIGKDTVSIAGLAVHDQYLAAVSRTNTTIFESGGIGVFGLGFFSVSGISLRSFSLPSTTSPTQTNPANTRSKLSARSRLSDYATRFLPQSLRALFTPTSQSLTRRQSSPRTSQTRSETTSSFLASLPTVGNLLTRLVLSNTLASPQFTLTLQRNQIQVGGNAGLLTLGGLPSGVKGDSLTWVPVRLYSEAEGGLAGPVEAPNEKYPRYWEIAIDDVYLDDLKIPRSPLVPGNISISALIDTGSSRIRGPPDAIRFIDDYLGVEFSCSTPHTLAFKIGGKMFPVDARDFVLAEHDNSAKTCNTAIAPTDVPKGEEGAGKLYSWALGTPFLKSVLASFYLGDITKPSRDPPRVGFLSTVPSDDGDQLKSAVESAKSREAGLSTTSEPAPTGVPAATQTNSVGVLQAQA